MLQKVSCVSIVPFSGYSLVLSVSWYCSKYCCRGTSPRLREATLVLEPHTLAVLMSGLSSSGMVEQLAAAGSPEAERRPCQYSLPTYELPSQANMATTSLCALSLGSRAKGSLWKWIEKQNSSKSVSEPSGKVYHHVGACKQASIHQVWHLNRSWWDPAEVQIRHLFLVSRVESIILTHLCQ